MADEPKNPPAFPHDGSGPGGSISNSDIIKLSVLIAAFGLLLGSMAELGRALIQLFILKVFA
jgi:hypothetical protein